MPITNTGKIAYEYCQAYKEMPTLTLAKKMYAEKGDVFNSVEHARTSIRTYRGQRGQGLRQEVKVVDTIKELTYDSTPPKLPESRIQPANVFTLPTSIKKVLLLSDLHIPYQNNEAVETAIKHGQEQNIDCVYLNGDLLDLAKISFHEQRAGKVSVLDEIESGKEFLIYLRSKFPNVPIYFIPGNHDMRVERTLMMKMPELNLPDFRIDVLLKLREPDKNVIFIPYSSKVYFGKLLVEHGDKLKGSGGVNPARTLALKFKRHTICGHFHRTSEAMSKVYDGDSVVCYSVACLTDLEPDFMPVNEHNLGFAIIDMLGGGEFIVHNKKISGGKVF